jgi:hypothetical protein
MQILNPLSRDSARDSAWRQSSGEQMLPSASSRSSDWGGSLSPTAAAAANAAANADVDRQSAAWDVDDGKGGLGPLHGDRRRRRRRPKRAKSRDAVVSLRESEMDRAVHGSTSQRSSGAAKLSRLTRGSGLMASSDIPPPPRQAGTGRGWSSLRKAHLEHRLEAVGQREREQERNLGKFNAFTSKLLGVFSDMDDDEDTGGEGQVLYYDNKELVRYGVFIQCVGTTLSGKFIWLQLAFCYLIALLFGLGGDHVWHSQIIELDSISSMTSSVCTLVAFMVGLCVSAALARWWQMRDACLGGLWGCIDDLCLIAGTIFADDVDHIRTHDLPFDQLWSPVPGQEARPKDPPGAGDSGGGRDSYFTSPNLPPRSSSSSAQPTSNDRFAQLEKNIQDRNLHDKERILRLGLASLALTFMQARRETSLEDLSHLVSRRLITPQEFRILSRHMGKAPGQICWCWIAHMFTVAAAEGRLGQQKLWWLHSRCAEARGCIGRTFAYIDTQIPLAYIHLLALLVKLTLFVMAVEAGVSLALWLEGQKAADAADGYNLGQSSHVSFSVRPYHITPTHSDRTQ